MNYVIKKYKHDDNKLLDNIKFLLGSDVWQKEHMQPLRRQEGKIFYLMFVDNKLVSLTSIYKNMKGDGHTIKEHRGKGYYKILFDYVLKDNHNYTITIGTANEIVKKTIAFFNGVWYLNRGKYSYYKFNL